MPHDLGTGSVSDEDYSSGSVQNSSITLMMFLKKCYSDCGYCSL